MTWLGKILAFVVLIASVAWMYFSVQAYVTRTNWKTELEKWKLAYEGLKKTNMEERSRNLSNEDALRRVIVIEQTKSDNLTKQVGDMLAADKITKESVVVLQKVIDEGDVKAVLLQGNLDQSLKELDLVRVRNTDLENKTTQLVLDAESANRERVRAQNEAKRNRSISEELGKKVEELALRVTELKATGGGSLRALLDKPAPPVLPNLRGEVDGVRGDLVTLSIGLDAGVSKGTILELKRLTGGGRYLGTVKVIDVDNKSSTAVFTSANSTVAFSRLRPDELPRKGDLVEPAESSVISR